MRRTPQRATTTRRDATGWPILLVFAGITVCFTLATWMWGRLAARAAEAIPDSRANAPLRLRISLGDIHALPGVTTPADSSAEKGQGLGAQSQAGVELRLRSPETSETTSAEMAGPSEVWVSEDSSAEVWIAENQVAGPQAPAPARVTQSQPAAEGSPQIVQATSMPQETVPVSSRIGAEAREKANSQVQISQDPASSPVRIVLNSPAEEGLVLRVRPSHTSSVAQGGARREGESSEFPLPVIWPRQPEIPSPGPSVLRLMRENLELNQSWSVAGVRSAVPQLGRESPRLITRAEIHQEVPAPSAEFPSEHKVVVSSPPDAASVVLTSNQTDAQSATQKSVSPALTVSWEWPGRTSTDANPSPSKGARTGGTVPESSEAFRLSLATATAALRGDNNRNASERGPLLPGEPAPAVPTDSSRSDFSVPLLPDDAATAAIPPTRSEDRRTVEPSIVGNGVPKPGSPTTVKIQEIPGASRSATMTALQADGTAVAAPANMANQVAPGVPQAAETPFEIIEESGELTVVVRRSKLLRTKVDVYRTAVVDSSICDVVQFTPREISILGKSQGATHVTFWFQDERYRPVTYLVRVTPDPEVEKTQAERYELLESHLAKLFPESKVDLIVVGDKLVVKGQARDAAEAAQIMAVIRGELVRARGVMEGRAADPVGQEAAGQTLPAIQVINMLRIPGPPQVALKVKIAELNRTAARNFGVDMHLNFDQGKFLIQSLLNISSGGSASVLGNFDGGDLQFGLHYLEEHGVVRLLSEPTLVTISGRPATFIAGGEFAVPTAVGVNGVGAVTTDFRAYGAIITFLPTVLDKDLIRLEVAPEFSQIDRKNMVNGTPGLRTRAVTTTVEMREGQTLAIAGLLDDSMTGNNQGDLPIFNQIFGRRSLSRNETELIILVTPEIVHPMEPEEVPPLPGFDVTEPTNHEFYIKGHLEGRPTQEYDSTTWPRLRRRYNAGGPAQISGPYGHGQ